jgi:methylated-DNA-protein-cysteine methyltransferase-like protein
MAASRAALIVGRVRAIPVGFVRAYSDIEPTAPRLVGHVLATTHERLPWHRVVHADGSIPKGKRQRELLVAEGVPMRGDRVDLRQARVHRINDEPMPTTAQTSLSEHLEKIPPSVRPTVKAAIKTVKEIAPKAEEISYNSRPPTSPSAMWKLVRYAVGGTNVVGVGTFTSHATLWFYRGRELDDGSGLLQGGGKDSRFITLRAPADAATPAVKRLVRKAFKLGGVATGSVKS